MTHTRSLVTHCSLLTLCYPPLDRWRIAVKLQVQMSLHGVIHRVMGVVGGLLSWTPSELIPEVEGCECEVHRLGERGPGRDCYTHIHAQKKETKLSFQSFFSFPSYVVEIGSPAIKPRGQITYFPLSQATSTRPVAIFLF